MPCCRERGSEPVNAGPPFPPRSLIKPSGVSLTEEIKTPAIPEKINAKRKDTTNSRRARSAGPSTSKRFQANRALERKKSGYFLLPLPRVRLLNRG